MATIIFRNNPSRAPSTGETVKSAALSISEVDNNFANINLDLINATPNNTANTLVRRDASGNINVGDLNSASDLRLKTSINKIENATDIINNIEGVEFTWKETNKKSYGVIAQELEKVLPELVINDGSYLSVSYLPLIAFLIEAIKEQDKRIQTLENNK